KIPEDLSGEESAGPSPDRKSDSAAEHSEQHTLGETLPHETAGACTQRRSKGAFLRSRGGTGKEQVCNACASCEENDCDEHAQYRQGLGITTAQLGKSAGERLNGKVVLKHRVSRSTQCCNQIGDALPVGRFQCSSGGTKLAAR